jgi:serine/threonine-protein kinase
VGKPSADAAALLVEMGFVAFIEAGNAAGSQEEVDRVYQVNPRGPVPAGTTVTLTVYGAFPTPSTPSSKPTLDKLAVAEGGTVTVSWTAQTCPTGQTLSGYKVVADGGGASVAADGLTAADVTTTTVTAGNDDFSVTYSYFCGQVSSDSSPPSDTVVVTPAAIVVE